jgi:predicted transcriptional regulator
MKKRELETLLGNQRYVTPKQLAKLWGVTEQYLANMRSKEVHPYYKKGRNVYYDVLEMQEFRRVFRHEPIVYK